MLPVLGLLVFGTRTRALAWALLLCALPRTAHAGEFLQLGVAGVTPDAKHVAIFSSTSGVTGFTCGLYPTPPVEPGGPRLLQGLLVSAACTAPDDKLLPLNKWQWAKRTALVRALLPFADPFDDKSPEDQARLLVDSDTGLRRIEVHDGDRFQPVLALPGAHADLTGVLALTDRYLIRVQRQDVLFAWDEVTMIEKSVVADVATRWLAARAMARRSTVALRADAAQGSPVFSPPPRGVRRRAVWEQRRAKAIEPVVLAWELADAQGPLTAEDVLDAVWLLALLDTPPRRLEALRLVADLRGRAPRLADAILERLEADPLTLALVPDLRRGFDPLWKLPIPEWGTLTDEILAGMSDHDVLWLHRQIRAERNFRFSDPELQRYFSHFAWYTPAPESRWRPLLAKPKFVRDPDAYLIGKHHLNLNAVRRAEALRGLAAPEL